MLYLYKWEWSVEDAKHDFLVDVEASQDVDGTQVFCDIVVCQLIQTWR